MACCYDHSPARARARARVRARSLSVALNGAAGIGRSWNVIVLVRLVVILLELASTYSPKVLNLNSESVGVSLAGK